MFPENYDNVLFSTNLKTLLTIYSTLDMYKIFAEEDYYELNEYLKIFATLQEIALIEKNAMQNPSSIDKKYIHLKIKKADFRSAVCDMSIRLQYELQNCYGIEGETFELLNIALDDQLITEEVAHNLHQLRICRNSMLHPSKVKTDITNKMLYDWCDILFKFIGDLNEQNSEN